MSLDVTDDEAQNRKDAYELASTLRPATCVRQVHVDRVLAGNRGADVLVELNQRTIPQAMLAEIGGYGDLRIEEVDGPTLKATIQL